MHLYDQFELMEVAREVIRRYVLVLGVLSWEKLSSTKMSRLLYWRAHICNKIQASDWYLIACLDQVSITKQLLFQDLIIPKERTYLGL